MHENDRIALAGPTAAVEAAFTYYSRLARVKRFVDQNISQPLSPAEAARIAGVERKYFSTFFHRATGMRFREWIARVRITRARRLFEEANHSVSGVAYAVGFRGVRTFERTFKKYAGVTPFGYKQHVQHGWTRE